MNHRLRALLLILWPFIDMLYNNKWPTDPSGGVASKEIKDESNRWDMSEFNNFLHMEKHGQIQMKSVWMEQLVFSTKTTLGQRAITGFELALASTIHNA